jgi:protein SCO1/2
MSVTARRILLLLAILAAALAAALAVTLYLIDERVRETARSATAPAIGGPFALVDHRGRAVTEADYRGKLMVVTFGYTFCPDVCSTGLYKIGQALDALGEDAGQVHPLFITVDPERDTAQALADYLGKFHPTLIGLTGSPEQVEAVAKAYRVYYAKAPPAHSHEDGGERRHEHADEGGDYLVDHVTTTYVMGRDGGFRQAVSHGASAEDLAAAIRKHL